jgi:hypothetical protein
VSKGLRGMYGPLNAYLAHLPGDQAAVRLTFAELEALLATPLSVSARTDTPFWSSSGVALHNWRRSGFRGRLDRANGAVTFTRAPWP